LYEARCILRLVIAFSQCTTHEFAHRLVDDKVGIAACRFQKIALIATRCLLGAQLAYRAERGR